MRKLKYGLLGMGLVLGLLSGTTAEGAVRTGNNGYIGGLLGMSSGNKAVGTGFGFGVNGGLFFHESFGLGVQLRSANHDRELSTFVVAVEGLYRFADVLPGLHLGAILGSSKLSGDRDSMSAFTYGAKAAFDFPVSEQYPVTLGADASVNFASFGTETVTFFNPMITGKFWF